MQLTRESDYAIRIVYCLAKEKQRRDARFISERMDVTLRFSLKILGKLVHGGLVRSYKGNQGGYELAKPASEISVKDVINAVEGPYQILRCVGEGSCCSHHVEGGCKFQRVFAEITEKVNKMLDAETFDQFID